MSDAPAEDTIVTALDAKRWAAILAGIMFVASTTFAAAKIKQQLDDKVPAARVVLLERKLDALTGLVCAMASIDAQRMTDPTARALVAVAQQRADCPNPYK